MAALLLLRLESLHSENKIARNVHTPKIAALGMFNRVMSQLELRREVRFCRAGPEKHKQQELN